MERGERVFAILLGLFGLVWALKAPALKYMDEDAVPGSGFLPLWLGLAMVVLVAIFLGTHRSTRPSEPGRLGRVLAIALALAVAVLLVDPLGFTLPVTALMVFLLRVMERESWLASLGTGLGVTIGLLLIFRVWLSVPLPRGPWGF
jgi:hypothetical protein